MSRVFKQDFPNVRRAGFLKRVMAMVYDALILIAIWMIVSAVAVALNGGEAIAAPMAKASLQSALLCFSFLFFAYFWTRNGQTLGMQAWRLRVQDMSGYKITWMQALIRFFAAMFSWVPLGLGYIWMFVGDEQLTWHDRWSESVVVQLPAPDKKKRKG